MLVNPAEWGRREEGDYFCDLHEGTTVMCVKLHFGLVLALINKLNYLFPGTTPICANKHCSDSFFYFIFNRFPGQ